MNEKLTLQDLVDLLAQKKGITKKDAELFLKEFFSVLSDTLCDNEAVKVKDLGTFKLTTVSRRESVDVNSGEKIEIPAHYRLSFQPDKELRELVNKPFASFESIPLENGEEKGDVFFDLEGVDVDDDIDEEDENEEKLDSIEEAAEIEIVVADIIEEQIIEKVEVESAKKSVELAPESKIELKQDERSKAEEEKVPVKVSYSNEAQARHADIPVIPSVEYSYSTTIETSEAVSAALSAINKKASSLEVKDNIPTFRESSSKDVLPKEILLPEVKPQTESADLSRSLLSENADEDIVDAVDDLVEEQSLDDETSYEDVPEFYSYQPSFWTRVWRKLPLILFVLIIMGALVYAFLKLFDVKYDTERFFGKKTATEVATDSLQGKSAGAESVLLLDSLAGETSKKLDSLRLEHKEEGIELTGPKESIPNVNKAEAKLMAQQADSREVGGTALARETIRVGSTLRTLATRYYGQAVFWVYIYEENKSQIDDPDNIPLGLGVTIPKAEKYRINAKDVNSVGLAREKESEIIRKARQKRFQQVATE